MPPIYFTLRSLAVSTATWFSHQRFDVRMLAVLMGWSIQFLVGGLAYYYAWRFYLLRHLHDLIDGIPMPQLTPSLLAWWLFSGMSWLFVIWGAFRCAWMARDKMFGSLLLYWVGVEVFSLAFLLDSGIPTDWMTDFLGAGILTWLGGALATRYAMYRAAAIRLSVQ